MQTYKPKRIRAVKITFDNKHKLNLPRVVDGVSNFVTVKPLNGETFRVFVGEYLIIRDNYSYSMASKEEFEKAYEPLGWFEYHWLKVVLWLKRMFG